MESVRSNAVCIKCLGSELNNLQNLAEKLSACCGCKKTHLHSSCAVPTTSKPNKNHIQLTSFVASGNKWFCEDCKSCDRCNLKQKGPCLINCSECHKNFHLACTSSAVLDKKFKTLWK